MHTCSAHSTIQLHQHIIDIDVDVDADVDVDIDIDIGACDILSLYV